MSRLVCSATPLDGLMVVERQQLSDDRGFLSRLFCSQELQSAGWPASVAQINHTATLRRGTVRGLHFQTPPHAEVKLVSCLHGQVWDVAVDLRPQSSTYLQWHAETLSAQNGKALLIPVGFAHGFQALTDNVELLYCHSTPYVAGAEAGLSPGDPAVGIRWPLPVEHLSARDANFPCWVEKQPGASL